MGWITIMIQFNGKSITFQIEANKLYNLNCLDFTINKLDRIYNINIIENMIILITSDKNFRDGRKYSFIDDEKDRQINNIDAYDWHGNHIWNIGDIVGNIQKSFSNIELCTKEQLIKKNKYIIPNNCSFDLCICYAWDELYIIDPLLKKVIIHEKGLK